MLNVDDPADAVSELQRAAKIGLAGAMIPFARWSIATIIRCRIAVGSGARSSHALEPARWDVSLETGNR